MRLLSVLLRFRFVWLNLLFAAYLGWLQPVLLQRMVTAEQTHRPDWLLGALLLGSQLFELAGLLLKRPASAFFARQNPDISQPNGCRENAKVAALVLVPVLHLGAAAMLTLIAFDLWGWVGPNAAAPGAWLVLPLFFVMLTKEAFFVVLMIGIGAAGSQHESALAPAGVRFGARLNRWLSPPAGTRLTLKEILMDLAGDLLLLVFAALTYTAAWEFVTAGSPLRHQGVERLGEYLGVSLMFFMVYFTTRSVYLMQEISIRQSRAARIFGWVSFGLVWAAALWGLG